MPRLQSRYYAATRSKMHGAVPTFHEYFEKIAFSHCGSNFLAGNRNDEDVFAGAAQQFFGYCGGETIPGNQKPQRAHAVSIFELLAEYDEFVLAALPAPVLAFGQNERGLAP